MKDLLAKYRKLTITAIILFVLSVATVLGTFDFIFPKNYVSAHYDVPCLTPAVQKAVNYNTVHLRVLNASSHAGLGQAVNLTLLQRGFSSHGYNNYPDGNLYNTKIVFGANSIKEAYTLALIFDKVILQMDDRQDSLIDVVIGEDFTDFKSADLNNSNQIITAFSGCVDPSIIKPSPAPSHEIYQPSEIAGQPQNSESQSDDQSNEENNSNNSQSDSEQLDNTNSGNNQSEDNQGE
ncbi:MAG: LytR C-terminal domain-containing protein [Bifidobacteriaceae bacterium]|jgi:hypothetical protein|nr:LytR C-terminal domain-containing protein [Bifidobacteriaceae bacterium]